MSEPPPLVRAAFERAVPDGRLPRQARLTQDGEMWLRPGARGLRFRATGSFAVERVAFAWDARFPLAGPLALRVRDDSADADGKLEVRLLGGIRVPTRGEAFLELPERYVYQRGTVTGVELLDEPFRAPGA